MEDFLSFLGGSGGGSSAAPMVSPYPDAYGAMATGAGGTPTPGPTVAQNQLASQQPGAGPSATFQGGGGAQGGASYTAPTWTGGGGGSNGIAQAGESC